MTLKLMRCLTGSQCDPFSVGVLCKCFGVFTNRWAAAFWRSYSFLTRVSGNHNSKLLEVMNSCTRHSVDSLWKYWWILPIFQRWYHPDLQVKLISSWQLIRQSNSKPMFFASFPRIILLSSNNQHRMVICPYVCKYAKYMDMAWPC